VDTDRIIDDLYGLALGEFTRARDEAARELRTAGQREEAEQVKALRKPTAAAGAVNRLVREHRAEVVEFLQAAAVLRDAQVAGKGDLSAATQREREALERLTRAGGESVRQTLRAAAVDEAAGRALLEGRLERELEPLGFGTLLAGSPPPRKKPAGAKEAAPTRDDRAARERLREAEAALAAAESEERQAQRRAAQAQRELTDAQAAVEKARRRLARLRDVNKS
jgi:hypothetical protein